jgi:hypothetical protein
VVFLLPELLNFHFDGMENFLPVRFLEVEA